MNTFEDVTWSAASVDLGEGWFMVSVNEGTINDVVDETGGVQQFLTDTGDDDNVVLASGLFSPAEGRMQTEARYKVADDVLVALYHGYTETLVVATPVMPAKFATATMTYNGSGGMTGVQYDDDGTTDDLRSLVGDGGAATAGSGNGTVLGKGTVTADEYILSRVEVGEDGSSHVFAGLTDNNEMSRIASYVAGLTPADLFYAILMLENREAAAKEFEVDYVFCDGGRSWSV
jgi:hypothetical protein